MDIEFSEEDLKFQKKVRDFIDANVPTGMELWSGRMEWFKKLKDQGDEADDIGCF